VLKVMLLISRSLVLLLLANSALAAAERPLPPLRNGSVLAGPGDFRQDGELFVRGTVTLEHMTLHLHSRIRVATGATLNLDHVNLIVSDPPGAPNGTSGLDCDGPAHIIVRHSTMTPEGAAHPMWRLQGALEVTDFRTRNSEFHLNHVKAELEDLDIFELEISQQSDVKGQTLNLVFLSTHSNDNDHLKFSNIPSGRAFTKTISMGSDAKAELTNARLELFLLYVHGRADVALDHMDRVQLAIHPQCEGTLRLNVGRMGSPEQPAVFPQSGTSNCPFHIALVDVNVDTWDVYPQGPARLTLVDSDIDELVARGHSEITVRQSRLLADWLRVSDDATLEVIDSEVGALRLASQRPDLATSQVQILGRGRAVFSKVRFDCGLIVRDESQTDIDDAVVAPKYIRSFGHAQIRINGTSAISSKL
jgi:hypothetical protein